MVLFLIADSEYGPPGPKVLDQCHELGDERDDRASLDDNPLLRHADIASESSRRCVVYVSPPPRTYALISVVAYYDILDTRGFCFREPRVAVLHPLT